MSATSQGVVVGGALLVAVHGAMPVGVGRDLLLALAGAAAALLVLLGTHVHRPRRRGPWQLIAAGLACWSAGNLLGALHGGGEPFPSVADVFRLSGYPLMVAGMARLSRNGRRDHATVVDALLVALAIALVLWVTVVDPAWTTAPEGTLLARVVGAAYPTADVVLLTQLVHLAVSRGTGVPTLRLLALGVLLLLAADASFGAAAALPVLEQHLWLVDTVLVAGYVLWASAALHPSMSTVTDLAPSGAQVSAERARARAFSTGRVVFLALVVLVVPVTILVELGLGLPPHIAEVSLSGVAIIGLTLVRTIDMVRHVRGQAERLAHLADTDFLTGLENRRAFTERLAAAISAPEACRPALLLIGLERFTEINDTLGHRTGDELLRAVSDRLREVLGTRTPMARMGGEVFGVLLHPGEHAEPLTDAVRRVQSQLAEPFALPDLSVTVDGAFGLVTTSGADLDAGELLHRADIALSAARESEERLARYSEDMENGGANAPMLITELRHALEVGDVVVHYQPQIEVATGAVLGVEALVRWQHHEHGLLAPAAFVPAAERTDLIRVLTLHVLDEALTQCARWKLQGLDLTVAVNLSVRNLLDPDLVTECRAALARHGVPASSLELEITETMAMVDPSRSLEVLGELEALGITLSVDDYGTGYGSLAYLQQLPVHRLKIDRSFVARVLDDCASAAIVRSTIELARHLGLSVIAEGVEDEQTLATLREMRCPGAQGFGIGRPVAADEVVALVRRIGLGARPPEPARVPRTTEWLSAVPGSP